MKRIFLYILLMICLLPFAGCSGSNDPRPDAGDGMSFLQLNISIADISPGTRSLPTRAEYFFEGTANSHEMMNTLRIIIVDAAGNVEHNRFVDLNEPVLKTSALFKVRMLEEKKIYLFANELDKNWENKGYYNFDKLTPGMAFPTEEINAITIKSSEDGIIFNENTDIPINESFTVKLTSNGYTDLFGDELGSMKNPERVSLFITRAAVKFTFAIKQNVGNLRVRFFSTAHNMFLLPHDTEYNPTKALLGDDTKNERTIISYSVPVGDGVEGQNLKDFEDSFELSDTPKSFPTDWGGNNPYYIAKPVYVCETSLANMSGGSAYQLQISTDNGEWSQILKLPNLESLPRNTHVVIRIDYTSELVCEAVVLPYTGVWLNPDFGIPTNK